MVSRTDQLVRLAGPTLAILRGAGLMLGIASAAWAAPITVNNPSFEILPAGGLPFGCGTGCSFSGGSIPGWSTSGTGLGQFQPGVHLGNLTLFNSLSDGPTSAYSNSGPISQTVGATVQAGVIYTLLVDIGDRNDLPALGH